MRFAGIVMAAAAVLASAPATANLITLRYEGRVDAQYGTGSSPYAKIGDTLTISFAFDPATQMIDPFYDSGDYVFQGSNPATFNIRTSAGLEWIAADEIHDMGVFLSLNHGVPTFTAHSFIKVNANLPELTVYGNRFSIVGPDYSERGVGFGGSFTLVDGIPEPATWALMIAGFGAVGVSARRRCAPRATRFPA